MKAWSDGWRRLVRAGAVAVALLAGSEAWAQGGNPTITVDEFGIGFLQFPGGPANPLPGVLLPDPGPGGLLLALTYNLQGPPGLVAGDLILQEVAGGPPSDVIRFNPANPATGYPASLVFYSDIDGGPDAPADVGLPNAFYANVVAGLEGVIPGGFGIIYTPTPNQPGFVPGFNPTYVILSDVPAPGALTLLGVAGLVVARRRR